MNVQSVLSLRNVVRTNFYNEVHILLLVRNLSGNSFIRNFPSKINVLESFKQRDAYSKVGNIYVNFICIFMTYVIIQYSSAACAFTFLGTGTVHLYWALGIYWSLVKATFN
jgi:hypothetical protein